MVCEEVEEEEVEEEEEEEEGEEEEEEEEEAKKTKHRFRIVSSLWPLPARQPASHTVNRDPDPAPLHRPLPRCGQPKIPASPPSSSQWIQLDLPCAR